MVGKEESLSQNTSIRNPVCIHDYNLPKYIPSLKCVCILALGSVLFALENVISVGSFHTLVTIHEPEQLRTCSSAGVSVPGRQNPP